MNDGTVSSSRLARDIVTDDAIRRQAKEERALNNVMSPLYRPGDDIDPSSPYYRHRP